jgi:DNA-binding response OmpR family regulator
VNEIWFIDDREDELNRFENAMKDYFSVITASGYEECITELKGSKPDLWVLDLYFPAKYNTPSELENMDKEYHELQQKIRNFQSTLAKMGQSHKEGLNLLERCKQYANVPVIYLTRKGTLENAIECLDKGAERVLLKPSPGEVLDTSKNALDRAFSEQSQSLRDVFMEEISNHSFTKRYEKYIYFVIGSLLGTFFKMMLDNIISIIL